MIPSSNRVRSTPNGRRVASSMALIVFPLVLALGCGERSSQTTPEPAHVPTWAELDGEGLQQFVQTQAYERLGEVQPELTPESLSALIASPEDAPALSGRAVERLFDLTAVHLAAGRLDEAEGLVRLIRQRAGNRNSAFAGNTYLVEIARRRAGESTDAQEAAIAEVFRKLPRARFGGATVIFRFFQNQEQLTARVEQVRQQLLSLDTAARALLYGQVYPEVVANRERFIAAIDVVQAEWDERPGEEPYAFPTVDITRNRLARPVNVAVWDVGTNPELFASQLMDNPGEEENGRDDDGNGQVDDVHGIVADPTGDSPSPHTALLFEPRPEIVEEYWTFLKGIMDLRAGLAASEDAQRVLQLVGSVTDAEELEVLEQNLDAIGEWAHGTHVAGIMLAGNPYARLAIFRSAWAGEARIYYQRGPTDDELAAERENIEAIAEFINRHNIRVVNASLGFSTDYLEGQLRHETELYPDDEAVRARAVAIQAQREANWRLVFERCPNTLFVVAAGNSNRDVVEYHDVPAALSLDNVLVVGAVDRFGSWATFTNSNPERVRIFDFGVEVPSLLPNGETVPLSGTSMASPNVANLAGKVYALNPELSPAAVARLIVETGDPIAAPFNGRIANEERALERAMGLRPAP